MNEKEFEECSVVAYPHEIRFLHIKGGCISYYVDRHISDYVNKIQKENQQLKADKADYGNKAQVEIDLLEEENKQLKEQLQQKEEIIDKARKYVKENSIYFAIKDKIGNYFANCNCDELLEILDNKGSDNNDIHK